MAASKGGAKRKRQVRPPNLLLTKIHIPPARPSLVARPRLTERLNEGLQRKLTLVSAPAGFGKTTLLREWIPLCERCVAWVSLDVGENDPARFWAYFIAALQSVNSDLGVDAQLLLQSSQALPTELFLTTLLNEIAAFYDHFALVLDDYHALETPALHEALTFFIDHLPPQLHLVLSTRVDPPLPLARWRARGELAELRTADLRFTTDEATAFLNRIMDLQLSTQDVIALESRTEGWIAGLQLAALSMRGRDDVSAFIASFAGSHRFILDYLTDQVLRRQSPSLQTFLLQTSILDRMCANLCDAVTGRSASQAVLEELELNNLFVVGLDEERQWYRYHRLFADVLRHRLRVVQAAEVAGLYRRASEWFERRGLMREAVPYAIQSGDWGHAARLIEAMIDPLALSGEILTLLGWLAQIPDAAVLWHPILCIAYAIACMYTNQFERAESLLQAGEEGARAEPRPERSRLLLGYAAANRGTLYRSLGDLPRCFESSRLALTLLPESDLFTRAGIQTNLAHAFLLHGNLSVDTEREVKQAIHLSRRSGHLLALMRSITLLARLQTLQGNLHQATATYREVETEALRAGGLHVMYGAPTYYIGLGDVLRECNDLDGAQRLLTQGMELALGTYTVDADMVMLAYVALARLERAQGNLAGAIQTLDAFVSMARQRHLAAELVAQVMAVRAQLDLGCGNVTAAFQWAESLGLTDEDLNYQREREHLSLARVLLARSQARTSPSSVDEALHLLDRLLGAAEQGGRMSSVIEILILRALALAGQSNSSAALESLQRALAIAVPEGFTRIFVDEGRPMQSLLQEAAARGAGADYASKLLAEFPQEDRKALEHGTSTRPVPLELPTASLVEPLSERELEVLRLIAAGESNREMAGRLIVSLGTVKKHLNNIFGKLGVSSRTQAVVRARELDLL